MFIRYICALVLMFSVISCNVPNDFKLSKSKPSYTVPNSTTGNHDVSIENNLLKHTHEKCYLVVNKSCAMTFKNILHSLNFNLAQITLKFWGNFTINQTSDAILPSRWVWTYFIKQGIVPYLKWPIDFKELSFGLLNTKTLSDDINNFYLDIDVKGNNCHLELGSKETTELLGYALGNMTQDYLYDKAKGTRFGYSYWCYLKEIPHVKEGYSYTFGLHFGFPLEFTRYNCCKTHTTSNRSELKVECINQVTRMSQPMSAPFILALLAFAYFPILLLNLLGMTVSKHYRNGIYTGFYDKNMIHANVNSDYENIDAQQGEDVKNNCQDWVYLDGRPPITFTSLFCGLCGLADKYPVCVSRCRRFLIIVIIPCVLYLEIYFYWRYLYDTAMAYLDKGAPLGYLTVVGGLRRSMRLFAPYLGGPPCLIIIYHVAAIIFLLIPRDLNRIMHIGSTRDSSNDHKSILFVGDTSLVSLSGIHIHEYSGFFKAAAVCKARIYMLTNPRFWSKAVYTQLTRLIKINKHIRGMNKLIVKIVVYIVYCLCVPMYVIFCLIELALSVVFYGFPAITAFFIFAKGYASDIDKMLENKTGTGVTRLTEVIGRQVLRLVLKILLFCLFVYFVFSISSIICASFRFIFAHIIMCFIAVISYPFTVFGYIFFFAILVYYVCKQLEYFGDVYFDLLSMAIEISIRMEEHACQARLENDVIIINKIQGFTISKIRVHDQIINLSTDQRLQIQSTRCQLKQRINYRKNAVGIPRELFEHLVNNLKPIHVQIFHTFVRLALISALVSLIISLIIVKPFGPTEDFGEVMHLIFIIVIGALPKILEVALAKSRQVVKEDIRRKKMKTAINDYWAEKDAGDVYVVI